MSTRILIQFTEAPNASVPADVKQVLDEAGATEIRASHPELPGLYTAILPNDADVADIIQRLSRSPQVRYAEVDQLRTTL